MTPEQNQAATSELLSKQIGKASRWPVQGLTGARNWTLSLANQARLDDLDRITTLTADLIGIVDKIVREMEKTFNPFEAVVPDGNPHILIQGGRVFLVYTGRWDPWDHSEQWCINFLNDIQGFLHAYANKYRPEVNDKELLLRRAEALLG